MISERYPVAVSDLVPFSGISRWRRKHAPNAAERAVSKFGMELSERDVAYFQRHPRHIKSLPIVDPKYTRAERILKAYNLMAVASVLTGLGYIAYRSLGQ